MLPEKMTVRVRERNFVEILDLSVLLCRRHAVGLVLALLAGVAPAWAFNAWCGAGHLPWWVQAWLLAVEAPLATSFLVLFLGQAVFVSRPSARKIARDFVGVLPQLLAYQLVVRAVLLAPVLTAPYLVARAAFLPEVILLERGRFVDVSERSSRLHSGATPLVLWRSALWLLTLVFLGASLWYALVTLRESLTGGLSFPAPAAVSLLGPEAQAAFWMVTGFMTVVRFLSYVDLRTRREGWELELQLRAAADSLKPGPSRPMIATL